MDRVMNRGELPDDLSDLRSAVLEWYVSRQRAEWSAGDEAALQRWLAEDVRHRQAYAQWEAHSRAIDGIPPDALAQLRQNLKRDQGRRVSRRGFLRPAFAVAAVAAVSAGLVWRFGPEAAQFSQSYTTQRGQQVDVPLPDGSRLLLDTATRVEVAFYHDRREVKLVDGQALFSVAADSSRPFTVNAGPVGVTVVGTEFSMRYTPDLPGNDGVQVSVAHGKVRVAADQADDGVYLTAGQHLPADRHGKLGAVMPVSDDAIAAWKERQISFVDTPLAQALAEFERYGATGLTIRDASVAALRLSGTFDPRDVATLRRVLPHALPVRLKQTGEQTEIVAVVGAATER